PTRDWFRSAFAQPTDVQERGWQQVAGGHHALMAAPTGSGKTLAAFLWCLDRLMSEPVPPDAERCRVLYVSPLKALAHDVDRNLRSPLVGMGRQLEASGAAPPDIHAAIRTGDTPAGARRWRCASRARSTTCPDFPRRRSRAAPPTASGPRSTRACSS